MKKIITIALALTFAAASFAQSMDDALTISTNDYYGTARSVALGNAMTAVGGDLGSVNINPAGSAVSTYSQFTVTPGLSFSTMKSQYSWVDGTTKDVMYGANQTGKYSWATMPNIGLNMYMDLHNDYGMKGISFGMIVNSTAHFSGDILASGRNDDTSMMGSFAAAATGFSADDLNSYNSNAPWASVAAYRSGMIYWDDNSSSYLGASETTADQGDGTYDIYTAGTVNHKLQRQTRGGKTDMVMNFGMNMNDNFYLGFNLGIPFGNYSVDNYLAEYAANTADFPQNFDTGVTEWNHSTYRYIYDASISGIYAKAGFIWRPVSFIRLGGAIQTPTHYSIEEKYTVYGTSNYVDTRYNGKDNSPEGSYEYSLRSPFKANLGAAFTLGSFLLLSADWEMCDYSTMRYKQGDDYDFVDNNILVTNEVMHLFCGTSHAFRFGAEANVGQFSIRGGYTTTGSAERWYYDNDGFVVNQGEYLTFYNDFANGNLWLTDQYKVDDSVNTVSFGFGYKSGGSFFADFAMRFTNYPDRYFTLYDNYIDGTPSPSVRTSRSYNEALVTVGWRF